MIENKFYSEDDLLPVSALSDFVFCERRAALHFVERIWEDNLFTAEGTILHERVDEGSNTEARGNIRISRSIPLRSLRLGLIGKADVVEFHKTETDGIKLEGVSGFWVPFPVEYKRGHLRCERSFDLQLCAQALCLEEMLKADIPAGALFYGKTRHRLDVEFTRELREETTDAVIRLRKLINSGLTPAPVYNKKCESCSLLSICMPKIMQDAASVEQYIRQAVNEL